MLTSQFSFRLIHFRIKITKPFKWGITAAFWEIAVFILSWVKYKKTLEWGVECEPPYFLVQATICTLSRPSHLKMLILKFFFFKCAPICFLKTFFKNPATFGHKQNIRFSRLNFTVRIKLKFSACHVLQNLWII